MRIGVIVQTLGIASSADPFPASPALLPGTGQLSWRRTTASQEAGGPGMVATVVIVALVIFGAGVVTAVTLLASYGIRHEERNLSLTQQAPGRLSAGTRRLTGLVQDG